MAVEVNVLSQLDLGETSLSQQTKQAIVAKLLALTPDAVSHNTLLVGGIRSSANPRNAHPSTALKGRYIVKRAAPMGDASVPTPLHSSPLLSRPYEWDNSPLRL